MFKAMMTVPPSASLILATCECARLSLPWVAKGEGHPLRAIVTAEHWARGEESISMRQLLSAARGVYTVRFGNAASSAVRVAIGAIVHAFAGTTVYEDRLYSDDDPDVRVPIQISMDIDRYAGTARAASRSRKVGEDRLRLNVWQEAERAAEGAERLARQSPDDESAGRTAREARRKAEDAHAAWKASAFAPAAEDTAAIRREASAAYAAEEAASTVRSVADAASVGFTFRAEAAARRADAASSLEAARSAEADAAKARKEAADARSKVLQKCAAIIRKYFPNPPAGVRI